MTRASPSSTRPGMHDYQPGYLYVALGQANGRWLSPGRADAAAPRRRPGRRAGDPDPPRRRHRAARARRELAWDYLVIATGARLVPDQIPGLIEGSFEFYSLDGARAAPRGAAPVPRRPRSRSASPASRTSARRRRSSSCSWSTEYLRKRGLRDRSEVTLLSPLNRAFTIETASKLIQPIMDERGIELTTFFNVEAVDPSARTSSSRSRARRRSTTCWCSCRRTEGSEVVIDSGPRRPRRLAADRPAHAATSSGHETDLRDRRRDEPADLEERLDGALRGAGGRQPDRLAGPGHAHRRRTTAAGSCASSRPATARRPRCGSTTSTRRSPPKPNRAWHVGEVDVQPPVLGDRAAGPDPRTGTVPTPKEVRPMSEQTIAKTLDLKGLSCPLPIVKTAQAIRDLQSGELIEVARDRSGLGRRLRGVVHVDRQRARRADRGRTASTGS